MPSVPRPVLDALTAAAAAAPGLELLLLFGSRARGDAHEVSDWDFGYLADDLFDPIAFLGAIAACVGSDRVDLVDLARASGLLRYRAARDGQVVFEANGAAGAAERFWLQAVGFWCDAEPVLRRGYDRVLAELPR